MASARRVARTRSQLRIGGQCARPAGASCIRTPAPTTTKTYGLKVLKQRPLEIEGTQAGRETGAGAWLELRSRHRSHSVQRVQVCPSPQNKRLHTQATSPDARTAQVASAAHWFCCTALHCTIGAQLVAPNPSRLMLAWKPMT
eukprot:SAG31_NODE_4027_length_3652_cov_3.901773_1_plen_143_part_00